MSWRLIVGTMVGGALGYGASQLARCTSGKCPIAGNPLLAVLIFAALGFWVTYGLTFKKAPAAAARPGDSRLALIASEKESESTVLSSALPVVVEFFATWCGPCQRMAPVMEEIAIELEGKATVAKVDVDKLQPVAARYRVEAVPTIVVFRSGNAVVKLTGVQSKQKLLSALESASR